MPTGRGFTLTELLVVIAIIAILMAVIIPALEMAVYRAELSVCGANFRGLSTAVTAYTSDNKRYYPHRTITGTLANTIASASPAKDDRPVLRPLFSINKSLHDPLSKSMDLETQKSSSTIFSDSFLYFSFRYADHRGVRRLGDSLEWKGLAFNVLASDQNHHGPGLAKSSHPDLAGRMIINAQQDVAIGAGAAAPASLTDTAGVSAFQTFDRWEDRTAWTRNPIDLNYLFSDGSVHLYTNVLYDDSRMWVVPAYADETNWPTDPTMTDGEYSLLPK